MNKSQSVDNFRSKNDLIFKTQNKNDLTKTETLSSLRTSDTLQSVKKKTASFNEIVSVINVENYKRYNSLNVYKKKTKKEIFIAKEEVENIDDEEEENEEETTNNEEDEENIDNCFLCVIF